MTRNEYLTELNRALDFLDTESRQATLSFYAELLDDRIEEGMCEEEAVSAMEKLQGRLDLLNEQLEGTDAAAVELEAYAVMNTEIGKEAAALDKQALANAIRERDFTSSALKTAVKRRSNLEEALAAAGRIDHSPAEYATLISAADARIEELTLRADAYETAKNAILAAGETVRSGVIPAITERASAMIAQATGEKHSSLPVEPSMGLTLPGMMYWKPIISPRALRI